MKNEKWKKHEKESVKKEKARDERVSFLSFLPSLEFNTATYNVIVLYVKGDEEAWDPNMDTWEIRHCYEKKRKRKKEEGKKP